MTKEEISQQATFLSEVLGKELKNDVEKLMLNICEKTNIYIGIRDGYELVKRKISFNEIVYFENQTVVGDTFKPTNLRPNDEDYYFGSEEITRFNSKNAFFGIIGDKWFENEMGDEFVEAIIFGTHNVRSIDCMLGSVRKNCRNRSSTYLAPGAIVALTKTTFKNTMYLEISTFLEKVFINNHPEPPWRLGNYLNTYYWNGSNYTTESNYSGCDDEDY